MSEGYKFAESHCEEKRKKAVGATRLNPGAHEKRMEQFFIIVPRTSTGAIAEKAKVWQDNLGKGTRQVSPVT